MVNAPHGPNKDMGSPDDNLVLVMVDETDDDNDDDNSEESSEDDDHDDEEEDDDGSSSSDGDDDEEQGTSEEFTDEDIEASPFILPLPKTSQTKKVTAASKSNIQINQSATNEKCDKRKLIVDDENALSSVGATVEGGRSTNGQDEEKKIRKKNRNLKSTLDKKLDKKTKQVWNRTLLYESSGTESLPCFLGKNVVRVQFYEHALVVRKRKKRCCFSSTRNTTIIPRYKLVDVEIDSRSLSMGPFASCCFWVLTVLSILVTFGLVLLLPSFLKCLRTVRGKRPHYRLKYLNDRSWRILRYCYLTIPVSNRERNDDNDERNKKNGIINEEFLYEYVFDAIEKTDDPIYLHRLTHMHHDGLMDPIKNARSPQELLTTKDAYHNPSTLHVDVNATERREISKVPDFV